MQLSYQKAIISLCFLFKCSLLFAAYSIEYDGDKATIKKDGQKEKTIEINNELERGYLNLIENFIDTIKSIEGRIEEIKQEAIDHSESIMAQYNTLKIPGMNKNIERFNNLIENYLDPLQ